MLADLSYFLTGVAGFGLVALSIALAGRLG